MSEFADRLKAQRLERMRMGQDSFEIAYLFSVPDEKVALVPLIEREYQAGLAMAAALPVPETMAGLRAAERYKMAHDLWQAVRTPENVAVKAFDSVEEMIDALEAADLNKLSEDYLVMADRSSPSLDGLTDEDLDELKKALWTIRWSELSGRQWAAVKACLSVLLPEQLQAKLSGSISTSSSTLTNIEGESTSTVVTD